MDSTAAYNNQPGPSSELLSAGMHEEGHISTSTTSTAATTPYSKPVNMFQLANTAALQSEQNLKDPRNSNSRNLEDGFEAEQHGPRLRSSRLFRGKGKDIVTPEKEQKKPLRLLDLPVDILKEIVKEVTHTNDLTSLALCHSALHRLTIPHIYSRFDIVWPDSNTHAEPRSGVDALTYGLATLVMAEEVFGEAPSQRQQTKNNRFNPFGNGRASELAIRRRCGNHYAQFTRKFSLGNGPADWVQEYSIAKEGGKMLGTLVALAVARMRSLETFVWDMPTGILRDVWLALSSLEGREDGKPCRLEKVWVRWHENTAIDTAPTMSYPPPPANFANTSLAHNLSGNPTVSNSQTSSPLARVERPTFSVLPALKSLSVLDIDELPYLDEMAVLIGKSVDKLRELRVGIARHATARDWVTVWDHEGVLQVCPVDPTAASWNLGERRFGGVLGVLTGFVHEIRPSKIPLRWRFQNRHLRPSVEAPQTADMDPNVGADESDDFVATARLNDLDSDNINHSDEPTMHGALEAEVPPLPEDTIADLLDEVPPALTNTLRLEVLELERVPISVPVLQRAINWPFLSSLTLLNCPNHEQLWKTLRRTFTPTPKPSIHPLPRRTPTSTPRKSGRFSSNSEISYDYHLNLKKIHTNNVSPGLISFLKETLAPNSLEILFLQEARNYQSSVSIDAIYKGPLRRHRGSLKKLLIDSSEKTPEGLPANSSRWRRWLPSHDILDFICSGKMSSLRELGIALEYQDWHFFLQNLPSIPHLRSLYIPFMADHVHGNVDPRELALQIVDIVALRPEIELCYMGISSKCFEILENRRNGGGNNSFSGGGGGSGGGNGGNDGDGRDGGSGSLPPSSSSSNHLLHQLGFGPAQHLPHHHHPHPHHHHHHHPGDVGSEEDEEEPEDEDEDAVVEDDDPDAEGEVEEEEEEEEDTESEPDDDDDDEDDDDEDEGDEVDEVDGDEDGFGAGFGGVGAVGAGGRASGRSGKRKHGRSRLRLREILFYDDKVAVFKARHGRL